MFELKDVRYKAVLDIPTLVIQPGLITGLIGDSGSGKTTLLKLLCKLVSPTAGVIMLNGKSLAEINSVEHRQSVVMLSQKPHLFTGTIKDNLLKGLMYHKKTCSDDVLIQWLNTVNLNKPLSESINNLSGGEAQRLALARVFVLDAAIYLMDEPSSALDEKSELFLIETIVNFVKANQKTLIMVTHNQSIAKKYCDTVIEFTNGHVKEGRLDDQ